jgi:hypothetical protein
VSKKWQFNRKNKNRVVFGYGLKKAQHHEKCREIWLGPLQKLLKAHRVKINKQLSQRPRHD